MGASATPIDIPRARRLDSVDLLRGTIMIIMALDHVRDFMSDRIHLDPVDLKVTTPGIFFTRWITHFCAPTFIFLAGTGAFLAGSRGKSKPALAWFLFTRGLWFALYEITINRAAWWGHWSLWENGAGVFWAIGWAMVALSLLVFLPLPLIGIIGGVLVVGHNALDGLTAGQVGMPPWLWMILHDPPPPESPLGYPIIIPGIGKVLFGTGYCLIPWTGTMALGYCFGTILLHEAKQRRKELFMLGGVVTLAFLVLRAVNIYGDPSQWSDQPTVDFTVCSFLNCTKYPASLLYLLMTLGPAILFLGAFDQVNGDAPFARQIIVFGRVPFFFYFLHIPLIHGTAVVIEYIRFHKSLLAAHGPWEITKDNIFPEYGLSLPYVYLVWAIVIVVLYLPCRWYADVKARRRDLWWLSYL